MWDFLSAYIPSWIKLGWCKLVRSSSEVLGWSAEGPRFESAVALLSLQKLWSCDLVPHN